MVSDAAQLSDAIPRIIAYWREGMRAMRDSNPRAGERGRREHALVSAVIAVAVVGRDDAAAHSALDVAARAYGALPRANRPDPMDLAREFGLLRHAICRCVQEQQADEREQFHFVMALDIAITLAVQGTLRGVYSPELDRAK